MNDLEKLWNETQQDASPTKRVALNAPQTQALSPLEKDGFPFVAHDMSFSPHLSTSEEARARHERKMQELTSSFGGPSSPNTIDLASLQLATTNLLEGAFSGDLNKVKTALEMGADSNTLVWVKDVQNNSNPPQYHVAPLGAAVAMLGQRQKALSEIEKTSNFDEVARLLLTTKDQKSKVQVGSTQQGGLVLGYNVSNIYIGDEAQFRHVPLSMSQQVAICRCVPDAMVDGRVPQQSDGVALGEELPKFLKDTYSDLYDPHRDSLSEALKGFRERRINTTPSSGGLKM